MAVHGTGRSSPVRASQSCCWPGAGLDLGLVRIIEPVRRPRREPVVERPEDRHHVAACARRCRRSRPHRCRPMLRSMRRRWPSGDQAVGASHQGPSSSPIVMSVPSAVITWMRRSLRAASPPRSDATIAGFEPGVGDPAPVGRPGDPAVDLGIQRRFDEGAEVRPVHVDEVQARVRPIEPLRADDQDVLAGRIEGEAHRDGADVEMRHRAPVGVGDEECRDAR